jgi:transposase
MTANAVWVGLDLGQERTNICVIDDAGKTLHELVCPTTLVGIEAGLSPFPRCSIGLLAVEAGAETHIVRKLRSRGYPVTIFESRKASKFLAIRRSKTDAGDARGLADVARLGRNTVSEVYLKSLACQQLRSRLVMRQKLVRLRVATQGSIRSRLALYGRRIAASKAVGGIRKQVEAQLMLLKAEEGIDLGRDLLPLVDFCESLRQYQKHLDKDLTQEAADHPVCRLLMGVPGVGPICALSFYTAIENSSRFRRTADVAAYFGLVPRRHQSGNSSRTLGITKSGSTLTRSHLVTAATVFRTRAPDCALKSWALLLEDRIGARRARVALARKLAILLLTIWKNGSSFEQYPAAKLDPPISG